MEFEEVVRRRRMVRRISAIRPLRHAQEKADGTRQEIICTPKGRGIYTLAPWPLNVERIDFTILGRHVRGKTFDDLEAFRAAYRAVPPESVEISVRPT